MENAPLEKIALLLAAGLLAIPVAARAQKVDLSQAEALLQKSGCTKCHAVSAKKERPAFKDIGARYKDKPDGAAAPAKMIATHPKIKLDGREETHDALKTRSEAEIKNVVAYILSR